MDPTTAMSNVAARRPGTYPTCPPGEEEAGFFLRLAGRHLHEITLADFTRLLGYLVGAGGARGEQVFGLKRMVAGVDRAGALACGLTFPPAPPSPFQVLGEAYLPGVWERGEPTPDTPSSCRPLHLWLVRRALEDGVSLPPEVLENYPELAPATRGVGGAEAMATPSPHEAALGERADRLARLNELCRGYTLHRAILGFIIIPADDFFGEVPGTLLEEFRVLMQWFGEEGLPVMWSPSSGWTPVPRAVVALYWEQPPDSAALQPLLDLATREESPVALLLWGICPRL